MNRRALTAVAALLVLALAAAAEAAPGPLAVPASGTIRVAFVIGRHAQMIDFAGPWEAFQDAHIRSKEGEMLSMPFELYTVAESREPIETTGGMKVVPDYTFDDAPQPNVIVVPAFHAEQTTYDWLKRASKGADVTMSVCTGAFILARAGLLEGLRATTHHAFLDDFAKRYPGLTLERGVRWVDNGSIATAAGLTSGIDLALHIVGRYLGEQEASLTAEYMEHAGGGWTDGGKAFGAPTP